MESEQNKQVWEKIARIFPDMLCAFDQSGQFTQVSDSSKTILGYDSYDLIGRHYSEFLFPDDFALTSKTILELVDSSKYTNFENRYIHKNGKVVPLRWSAVWSEDDKAIICKASTIAERTVSQSEVEVSEQRYKVLFDHYPDVVYVENKEGLIIDVNDCFCATFGVTKKEALNRTSISFLPAEMAAVVDMTFRQALQGSTLRCDLEILCKNNEKKVYDTTKYPISINGKIEYVQTIAKDITPMIRSYETIQQQANKLNTIFESITDAFYMIDRTGKLTYINKEAERLLRLNRSVHLGKNILDIFPEEAEGEFYKQYSTALTTKKAVHFTAYLKNVEAWFRVKAFPSEEGLSIYFDDITELVKIQEELEKLSLVASKTNQGVIITDAAGNTEWVNDAFTDLTGFALPELQGEKPASLLMGEETDQSTLCYMENMLKQGDFFNINILLYKKTGEKAWFSIDTTPVHDKAGKRIKFIIVIKDITERVKIRQELKLLSLVASHTSNGVLISDKQRRIEWVNEGFTKITGYSFKEAIGKTPDQLLLSQKSDIKLYREKIEQLSKGHSVSFDILNKRKSGEDAWFSVQSSPILNEKGEVERYISLQTDITEKRLAQKELEKLSLVASKINNSVVITDHEDRVEWINNSFTQLCGTTIEDVKGKTSAQLLLENGTDKSLIDKLAVKINQNQPFKEELLVYTKTGVPKWIETDVTPVFDANGHLSRRVRIISDITQRINAQQELEKLSLVASKTNNSVIIADKDWKIEWVNNGFTRLLGYTPEEAIGKKPSELLHNQRTDRTLYDTQEEKLLQGEPISLEILVSNKFGEDIWLNIEISPVVDEQGIISGFVEVQTDITAIKNSETELSKLANDLYVQNNDLQQFTYMVSHNLRAPVANAMGLADMLESVKYDAKKFDTTVCYLRQSINKLDLVLRDMNTILSIRDSKGNIEKESIYLKSVFQQALSSFKGSIQKAQVQIEVANDFQMITNKVYLYSIFYNLLSNSLKYKSDDKPLTIKLKCFANETYGVGIYYSDNGIGFDMKKAKGNVFKLYKRFHTSQEGRGMGLYLIKSHIQAMGGKINVSSVVGAGTKFLIYLPQ